MFSIDPDDVLIMIKSILSAVKDALNLKELEKDYYEQEGKHIPFRQLGHASLVGFLEAYPQCVTVIKSLNGISVRPVVTGDIAALARLVAGQKKTTKKKKPKTRSFSGSYLPMGRTYGFGGGSARKTAAPFLARNGSFFQHHRPNVQSPSFHQNSGSSEYGNQNTLNRRPSLYSAQPTSLTNGDVRRWPTASPGGSTNSDLNKRRAIPKSLNSLFDSTDSCANRLASKPPPRPTTTTTTAATLDPKETPWIENAAYFLKENEVFVSHVDDDCVNFYIRLVGENFSDKYEKMLKELNSFYSMNANSTGLKVLEENKICVGFDEIRRKYFRVQVKGKVENKIKCYFVDIGRVDLFLRSQLFEMKEDFLKPKFQAIKVQIHCFDRLLSKTSCFSLSEIVVSSFLKRRFIARRIQNNPLTISLFADRTQQTSLNETIYNDHEMFTVFKPIQSQCFAATLSFIDEETNLYYLQMPNFFNFESLINDINAHFNNPNNLKTTTASSIDFEHFKKNFFCARYYLDKIWYRAKVLRGESGQNTMTVQFVDYGNKEVISLEDFQEIPAHFATFKSLPPQAYKVMIEKTTLKNVGLKDCLFEQKPINFKVARVNSSVGIPSVEVINMVNDPSGTAVESDSEIVNMLNKLEISGGRKLNHTGGVGGGGGGGGGENIFNKNLSPNLKVQNDLHSVTHLRWSDMPETSLLCNSRVFVSYINHALDFVVNLEASFDDYQVLMKSMKLFYYDEPAKYRVKSPKIDYIYVYRNEVTTCRRVRLLELLSAVTVKVYDIDTGCFYAFKLENLYHIINDFTLLRPLAIKVQLGNIAFDKQSFFSNFSKVLFENMVTGHKVLKASVFKFCPIKNSYMIDLSENNISISDRLLDAGLAKPPANMMKQ
jgi:hypothetical protein